MLGAGLTAAGTDGHRTLKVGAGRNRGPDGITLDISPEVNPDVVWDLDQYPYPFPDNRFDVIECRDVIEHLANIPRTLQEFWRILTPGGAVEIATPHFSCANSYIDPTHRWHLSYYSFDYFTGNHELDYYSPARFRIERRYIHFYGTRLNRFVVCKLANRFPERYEQRWAWLFPAWFLEFQLVAEK